MGVVVSSSVLQSGSAISGDVPKIVVIHTNPGYRPDPGSAGTGHCRRHLLRPLSIISRRGSVFLTPSQRGD
jgi:hypothetical protein